MATTTTADDGKDVSTLDQLDERDARALTECMTTLPTDAPGMYDVVSESGSAYTVDARDGSCTCPDAMHRDITCKHIRRARFAVGRRAVPDWVDDDAVDPQLGDQVPTVMADGGSDHCDCRDDTDLECARCAIADGGRLFGEDEVGDR